MSFFWVLFVLSIYSPIIVFVSYTHVLCSCPHGIVIHNFCLKHFGCWSCSFHTIPLCTCHTFVHKSFWHVILINCRLWYEGTPKYLGQSVTGSQIRIQNWQVAFCAVVKTVEIAQQRCWQMCRWVGVTLLCMCKVFPAGKREADDHDIILVMSKSSVYIEGREYIKGSALELDVIIWFFGSWTFWLPSEKSLTLCHGYFSASHGVRVHFL